MMLISGELGEWTSREETRLLWSAGNIYQYVRILVVSVARAHSGRGVVPPSMTPTSGCHATRRPYIPGQCKHSNRTDHHGLVDKRPDSSFAGPRPNGGRFKPRRSQFPEFYNSDVSPGLGPVAPKHALAGEGRRELSRAAPEYMEGCQYGGGSNLFASQIYFF